MLLQDPLIYGPFLTDIMKYLNIISLADIEELKECQGFREEHTWKDCHSGGFALGDISFGHIGEERAIKIAKLRQQPKWYIRAPSSPTDTK